MASPFKSMAETSASRNFDYIRPGRYIFRIEEFCFGKNRARRDYGRFSFTCVGIVDPSAAATDPRGPHRLGEKVSWVLMADKDASAGNLKSAIMVATGLPEIEVTDEGLDALAGPTNPLKGLFVEVESLTKKKVNSPGEYTLVRFRRALGEPEVKAQLTPENQKALGIL